MKFTDTAEMAGTRRDAAGNLIAEAFAVRTGVQVYRGSEVGLVDREVVRVYRPEDEVRDPESMKTFSHATITMDHPSEPVTPDNWDDLAKGEVSTEATWDGNKIKLPLIIKDADAIKAIEGGKRELSAGYTCKLDWALGTTADGEAYDAIQREIRINHLAIVDRGRAGAECRIGDADYWGAAPTTLSKHKETLMTDALTTVVLGDKAAQVAVADAPLIEAFKAHAAKALADMATAHKAEIVTGDKSQADAKTIHAAEITAKDEEIGKLKADNKTLSDAAITPEKMTALIADRVALETTVKAISDDIKVEGVSDADLRKAAVTIKLGAEMVADESEATINGMFKAIAKDVAKSDLVADVIAGGVKANDGLSVADKAYNDNLAYLQSAHLEKKGA